MQIPAFSAQQSPPHRHRPNYWRKLVYRSVCFSIRSAISNRWTWSAPRRLCGASRVGRISIRMYRSPIRDIGSAICAIGRMIVSWLIDWWVDLIDWWFIVPDEMNWDPITKSYGDPTRRPEIKCPTVEFIAPSEYMVGLLGNFCYFFGVFAPYELFCTFSASAKEHEW